MKRGLQRSFTLPEVMAVLFIIGVLAALIGSVILKARDGANRTQAEVDISTIYKALAEYKFKFGDYPDSLKSASGDVKYTENNTNLLYRLSESHLLSFDRSRVHKTNDKFLDPWGNNAYQIKVQSSSSTPPADGMVGAEGVDGNKTAYIYSYGTGSSSSSTSSDWAYVKGGR